MTDSEILERFEKYLRRKEKQAVDKRKLRELEGDMNGMWKWHGEARAVTKALDRFLTLKRKA